MPAQDPVTDSGQHAKYAADQLQKALRLGSEVQIVLLLVEQRGAKAGRNVEQSHQARSAPHRPSGRDVDELSADVRQDLARIQPLALFMQKQDGRRHQQEHDTAARRGGPTESDAGKVSGDRTIDDQTGLLDELADSSKTARA